MQVGVGVDQRQGQFHRRAHAHLVDVAHVKDFQVLLVHKALLAFVHTADADLANPLGRNGGYLSANFNQRLRPMPAQARHWHAVDIAAGSQRISVEVGMGVQPHNAQLFADVAAVARYRADRADAQAMVAAQHDGQTAVLQFGIHRVMQGLVPGHDFWQVPVAIYRR